MNLTNCIHIQDDPKNQVITISCIILPRSILWKNRCQSFHRTGCCGISYRKKLETCHEENYTDFLSFNNHLLRKGMLEQMAIESYSLYYIANQICRVDQAARVILADDVRRTIGQIISGEGKKPLAVFITSMSSSFQGACAATLILNRVKIPVVLGGIHVSTSPGDLDIYIRPFIHYPELVSQVIGAGDVSTLGEILGDLRKISLKREYHGEIPIENGAWGSPRVIELPKIRPPFINKIPLIGPFFPG